MRQKSGKLVANKRDEGPNIRVETPKTMPSAVELSRRYLRLQTGDVNGALTVLKEETQMLSLRIKPLRRGTKCAGVAVTWHAVLANHDPIPRKQEPYDRWLKIWEHIYPGSVLVYQPGGESSSGHLGNLYSNMVAARGAVGAIVDGNLRDSDAHERILRWAPFSRGTSPLEAAPRLKWMSPNTPILMSGEMRTWIEVFPGDFAFGDGDGVIIIPKRLILPVLQQAESTSRKEVHAEKAYAAGKDPDKVMKKYGVA